MAHTHLMRKLVLLLGKTEYLWAFPNNLKEALVMRTEDAVSHACAIRHVVQFQLLRSNLYTIQA